MSDIVHTGGRRMSKNLQRALDAVPATHRDRMATILAEGAEDPYWDRIKKALALELRLCELREQDTLRQMKDALEGDGAPDA